MTPSIAVLAEGDAETSDCWSGCARSFVRALRRAGSVVHTVNVELRGWDRVSSALGTASIDHVRWRWRYRLGGPGFRRRTRRAVEALSGLGDQWDAVVQIGAPCLVPPDVLEHRLYVLYCDSNAAYARSGAPFSGISSLSPDIIEEVAEREKHVYDVADRIWTMSKAVIDSFVNDFGQPEEKCTAIFGGSNLDLFEPDGDEPTQESSTTRRVLFVGRDYRRKGLDLLLEAFGTVQALVPDAELHIVGGEPKEAVGPGIVVHGYVPQGDLRGRARLVDLYRSATVFCLPTRYEPFGVAFIEAMMAGLPCIGPDRWAVPEIIADGETGWLIPDGDIDALADRLREALLDPATSRAMGAAGRDRARSLFTWDHSASRALRDLAGWQGERMPGHASDL